MNLIERITDILHKSICSKKVKSNFTIVAATGTHDGKM